MYKNKIIKYNVQIQNSSPLIIGTGEYGFENLQIQEERAKIPASTLAGIFRSEILKDNENEKLYEALFLEKLKRQDTEKKLSHSEKRKQSLMSIEDSYSKDKIEIKKHIGKRTNIKIDPKTGVAEEKKLFETFYIKPGQKFEFEVEFRKFKNDNPKLAINQKTNNEDQIDIEDEILLNQVEVAFDEFIEKLHNGDQTIGANENKGFGRFEVIQLSKTFYDLTVRNDVEKYLDDIVNNLQKYVAPKERTYNRDGYCIELICPNGMIIKDKIHRKNRTNIVYSFREDGEKIYKIPASSLKGVVKSYCESLNVKESLINKIFGSEESKGLVKFDDIEISSEQELVKHRICIDRFTGGALQGAMVNENLIFWKKPIQWIFDCSNLDIEDRKEVKILVLKIVRGLSLGQIRIGSGSGVGYGKMVVKNVQPLSINREEVE